MKNRIMRFFIWRREVARLRELRAGIEDLGAVLALRPEISSSLRVLKFGSTLCGAKPTRCTALVERDSCFVSVRVRCDYWEPVLTGVTPQDLLRFLLRNPKNVQLL